jgi:hypothetical protein
VVVVGWVGGGGGGWGGVASRLVCVRGQRMGSRQGGELWNLVDTLGDSGGG